MANLEFVLFMCFASWMVTICVSKCPRVKGIKNLRSKYGFQGRLVYFRCRRGFDLIGPRSAVCNGGKWSTEFPICIAPGCQPLEYDQNVLDVTYTYRGSLASFQCKANYVMEDKDNRVYCDKIKWNKSPPKCTKNSLKKSCNYEDGICGWTQDWTDEFDWEIHSKETSTKFTGPTNDHTYGSTREGHYIYTEASAPRRSGDQARLLSPLYNFKMKTVCFEFWFHMWCPSLTKEAGSLEVYAVPENQSLRSIAPLVNLSGDFGNTWNSRRIQIPPFQRSFQIIFQATRGMNHQNDMAVDDIQMWEGLCEDGPNITYPLSRLSKTVTTLSSDLKSPTEGIVITGKGETLPTTLSTKPTLFISSVTENPVFEENTEKKLTSNPDLVSINSSSTTERKTTEKTISITSSNTPITTDLMSPKIMDSSSMASITVTEQNKDEYMSTKLRFHQSSMARKMPAKNSGMDTENYSLLAIGITVALLFGIGVIFFIVWVWARTQDKKRAMAEDEEETQPITNAESNCSLQNGF